MGTRKNECKKTKKTIRDEAIQALKRLNACTDAERLQQLWLSLVIPVVVTTWRTGYLDAVNLRPHTPIMKIR